MKETRKATVNAETVKNAVAAEVEKVESAVKNVAEKAAPVVKAAAEKAAPAKEAAKKPSKRGRKKAVPVSEKVCVQFSGKSYTTEELVKIAKDVWKYDLKKKVSDFRSVELFVKPEESTVYYVINGEISGSFAI